MPVGNIEQKQTEHGVYDYGYDAADRLTSAQNPTLADEMFTYDAVGNRKTDATTGTTEWQYDERDRLLSDGATAYDYDANGSLIFETEDSTIQRRYEYDIEGRLAVVKDANDALIAEYRYDPQGRRVSKTVSGETIYFLYAEEGLIAEYDAQGNVIAQYGYSPGSGYGTSPLWTQQDGAYAYYHRDHLGTPQLLTDQSNQILWAGQSLAFGEVTEAVNVVENRLRFPGQYFDFETGRHYNYFRDYDPTTGRYVQSDPIGLRGGLNTYGYVLNNPISLVDPSGQNPLCPILITADGPLIIGDLACVCLIGVGMYAMSSSPPQSGASDASDKSNKSSERKVYKKRCLEQPPPGLDPCEEAKWKLQRNLDCLQMRKAFSKKWYNDNEPNHLGEITNLEIAIQNLRKWIEDNCCDQCTN